MSWLATLILLLFVLAYIVVGGVVFHYLEIAHEKETIVQSYAILRQFLGQLRTLYLTCLSTP